MRNLLVAGGLAMAVIVGSSDLTVYAQDAVDQPQSESAAPQGPAEPEQASSENTDLKNEISELVALLKKLKNSSTITDELAELKSAINDLEGEPKSEDVIKHSAELAALLVRYKGKASGEVGQGFTDLISAINTIEARTSVPELLNKRSMALKGLFETHQKLGVLAVNNSWSNTSLGLATSIFKTARRANPTASLLELENIFTSLFKADVSDDYKPIGADNDAFEQTIDPEYLAALFEFRQQDPDKHFEDIAAKLSGWIGISEGGNSEKQKIREELRSSKEALGAAKTLAGSLDLLLFEEGEADIAGVRAAAKRLDTILVAYGQGNEPSLSAEFDPLRKKMFAAEGPNGDFIKNRASDLSGWLQDVASDEKVNIKTALDDLLSLTDAVFKTTRRMDAAKTVTKADQLVGFVLKKEGNYSPPVLNSTFNEAVTKLLSTVDNHSVSSDAEDFRSKASRVEKVLVDWQSTTASGVDSNNGKDPQKKKEEDTEDRRATIRTNTLAIQQAKATRNALDLLLSEHEPRIHIIRAVYGDLNSDWKEKRACDATLAFRDWCEGELECEIPAAVTKPNIEICGFDPIPQADLAAPYRGSMISFTCVSGGKKVWNEVALKPKIHPADGSSLEDKSNPRVNVVRLQSSKTKFSCPHELREVSTFK